MIFIIVVVIVIVIIISLKLQTGMKGYKWKQTKTDRAKKKAVLRVTLPKKVWQVGRKVGSAKIDQKVRHGRVALNTAIFLAQTTPSHQVTEVSERNVCIMLEHVDYAVIAPAAVILQYLQGNIIILQNCNCKTVLASIVNGLNATSFNCFSSRTLFPSLSLQSNDIVIFPPNYVPYFSAVIWPHFRTIVKFIRTGLICERRTSILSQTI